MTTTYEDYFISKAAEVPSNPARATTRSGAKMLTGIDTFVPTHDLMLNGKYGRAFASSRMLPSVNCNLKKVITNKKLYSKDIILSRTVKSSDGTERPLSNRFDIVFGRGGLTNNHPASKKFREVLRSNIPEYRSIKKGQKTFFVTALIKNLQDQDFNFFQGKELKEIVDIDIICEKAMHYLRDEIKREKNDVVAALSSLSRIQGTERKER